MSQTSKMGKAQRDFLRVLRHHGQWAAGADWRLGTIGQTKTMCERLAQRGLVAKTTEKGQDVYRPTEAVTPDVLSDR